MDREQNEAFIAAQDAAGGQHRDAQGKRASSDFLKLGQDMRCTKRPSRRVTRARDNLKSTLAIIDLLLSLLQNIKSSERYSFSLFRAVQVKFYAPFVLTCAYAITTPQRCNDNVHFDAFVLVSRLKVIIIAHNLRASLSSVRVAFRDTTPYSFSFFLFVVYRLTTLLRG